MARPARPPFPEYFLGMAKETAKRADCTRLQVGAIITQGDRIWATGYNGPPESGQPGCLQGACPRGRFSYDELPGYRQGNQDHSNCISVHAEINAICQFNSVREQAESFTGLGRKPLDAIPMPMIWVTHEPCRDCQEVIRRMMIMPHWPGHGYLEIGPYTATRRLLGYDG